MWSEIRPGVEWDQVVRGLEAMMRVLSFILSKMDMG